MTTLEIGSRTHGTLRNQDIADAILSDLRKIGYHPGNLSAIEDIAANDGEEGEFDAECIADAMDELNAFVPAYCYYGSHEGDGSDIGVWVSMDSVDEAVRDSTILKVDDLSEADGNAAQGFEYILVVNDHGNCSLYPVILTHGEEIWGVV